MKPNTITLREARANISKLLRAETATAISSGYGNLRGFIVPVPAWPYGREQRKKALAKARALFEAAAKAQTD